MLSGQILLVVLFTPIFRPIKFRPLFPYTMTTILRQTLGRYNTVVILLQILLEHGRHLYRRFLFLWLTKNVFLGIPIWYGRLGEFISQMVSNSFETFFIPLKSPPPPLPKIRPPFIRPPQGPNPVSSKVDICEALYQARNVLWERYTGISRCTPKNQRSTKLSNFEKFDQYQLSN